ncbi:cytochrome c oxidase assembly protein subunit 15 [Roseivirga ehrenbergii]|uniref:Cytochrome oxidase assembly protein n=1 Tax=Roseivirga ehrenbergii (strain DSM 102268 / JCM 13514 / KCTC 12282 / NCIMB 14502 / KMM 6017) TaxID=279360 RepID=A0A150X6H4_ROSEK|nr:COX15/CtaA family protein [Roseivirga ehrenbergii]KYG74349.1 cytochrome oxidase assembly protein [Roseivirga ehrenbergii]TCL14353.1 cytochrome c oxidase assembly protein subunit 15 [Roseivirga ehrenbergii]
MGQKVINGRAFRRFSAVTVIAVYLLILIGGIVRTTGSGMGCPDWPKCFGSWVPPTDVSQLPSDYKEVYAQERAEKNKRFVSYLTAFGFDELADQILNDPDILTEEEFNATKTLTEYINRLVGAVIGLLIFGTFIMSIRYWRTDRTITVLSFIAFVLVGFQGWIGSIVVSTNLLHWMITIHMLLALLIVCLLIYVYYRSKREVLNLNLEGTGKLRAVLLICFITTLPQIVMGTQVRESIDLLADHFARSEWISKLGMEFLVHRSYSILLLGLHLYLVWLLTMKKDTPQKLKLYGAIMLLIVGIEVLSGVVMAYFGVPAAIQPIHLLLGTLIIGVQYYVLLLLGNRRVQTS